MTELTIYDMSLGYHRTATQEDLDLMHKCIMAAMDACIGRVPPGPGGSMRFQLALYPNKVRPGHSFIHELLPIEPYPGCTGLRGEAIYPPTPQTGVGLRCDVEDGFATELVLAWNSTRKGKPDV